MEAGAVRAGANMGPLLRLAAVAAVLASASALAADLKVGVITSLSGPVSGLGVPYGKGIQAAQSYLGSVRCV